MKRFYINLFMFAQSVDIIIIIGGFSHTTGRAMISL